MRLFEKIWFGVCALIVWTYCRNLDQRKWKMPSNQYGIFVPRMELPANCYLCPFMKTRANYYECWVDKGALKYPEPRTPVVRPVDCPLEIVTNGMINNTKGEN